MQTLVGYIETNMAEPLDASRAEEIQSDCDRYVLVKQSVLN